MMIGTMDDKAVCDAVVGYLFIDDFFIDEIKRKNKMCLFVMNVTINLKEFLFLSKHLKRSIE
jgi:hypothetical protein